MKVQSMFKLRHADEIDKKNDPPTEWRRNLTAVARSRGIPWAMAILRSLPVSVTREPYLESGSGDGGLFNAPINATPLLCFFFHFAGTGLAHYRSG